MKNRNYILQVVLIAAALVSSFLLLVLRIVTTVWLELFVNNSDSLVLPLVKQSVINNEPFAWIFSSQVFLFPEAVMYAIANVFVNHFSSILLLNAFFNYILLAGLLFTCFRLTKLPRRLAGFFSLYASLFVVGMAWLEQTPANNRFVAMPFFTTTYYTGTLLSALAALALVLYVVNRAKQPFTKMMFGWLVILAGICLLTAASNPMFVLQFVLPISIVLVLAFILRRISWRTGLLVLVPVYAGVLMGFVTRKTIFAPYIAADVNGYINPNRMHQALERLRILLNEAWTSQVQRLEVLAIGMIVLASFVWFAWLCLYIIRKRKGLTITTSAFIMAGLAGLTPLFLLSGLILSGNSELRYLLPVVVFPFLALGSLSILPAVSRPRFLRMAYYTGLGVCLLIISLAVVYAPPTKTVKAFTGYYPPEASCLDRSLQNTPYRQGVAQFWRARTLQLHSKTGLIVSQVTPDITRYEWLSNRAVYTAYNYDFVVADSPKGATQYITSLPESTVIASLGQASDIYDCGTVVIYAYLPDTPGYNTLNAQLR